MPRLQQLLIDHGFQMEETPGFVLGVKPERQVALFTWANDVHANSSLTPRRYLVIVPRTGGGSELARWRLPLVEWVPNLPVSEQANRPWADVAAEFAEVFAPVLGGDGGITSSAPNSADRRYQLETPLRTAVYYAFGSAALRGGKYQVAGRTIAVVGRALIVTNKDGSEQSLALTEDTDEHAIAAWLTERS